MADIYYYYNGSGDEPELYVNFTNEYAYDRTKWQPGQTVAMNKYVNVLLYNDAFVLPESAEGLFAGCYEERFYYVDKWDFSECTNISGMFSGCSNLTEIDPSKWDLSHVTNVESLFSGCTSLATIYSFVNTDWAEQYNMTSSANMFLNCTSLPNYSSSITDINGANADTYFTAYDAAVYYKEDSEGNVYYTNEPKAGYSLRGSSSTYFYEKNYIVELYKNKFILPQDSGNLFYHATNVEFNDTDKWDSHLVTKMDDMFSYSDRVVELDLRSLDTSNVTDMGQLFYRCSSLEFLDLRGWNVRKVTDMYTMFANCSKLTTIVLPQGTNWQVEVPYGADTAYMFSSSTKLPNYNSSYLGIEKANNNTYGGGYFSDETVITGRYYSMKIYVKANGMWKRTG